MSAAGQNGEELNVSKSSPLHRSIRTSMRRADTSQKGQKRMYQFSALSSATA
jgi:hypothetical protein